jgi:hypothetical protein
MEYHELSGYAAPATRQEITVTDPYSLTSYGCCFSVNLKTVPINSAETVSKYTTRLISGSSTIDLSTSFPTGSLVNTGITYCIEKESAAVQKFFNDHEDLKIDLDVLMSAGATGSLVTPQSLPNLSRCNTDDYEISCDDVMDECSAEVDRYCETQCKDPVPCPPPGECPEPDDGGPWWVLWMLIIAALLAYIMIKK